MDGGPSDHGARGDGQYVVEHGDGETRPWPATVGYRWRRGVGDSGGEAARGPFMDDMYPPVTPQI